MGLLSVVRDMMRRAALVLIPLVTAVAVAQAPSATCSALVQEALMAANGACSLTQRNAVCYGNIFGEVTPAEGVMNAVFEAVGDTLPLHEIRSLHLSPLDTLAQQWGVALMQVQATLPDTLPGQNVTFLMFGDVEVEQSDQPVKAIPAVAQRTTNVRAWPSTQGRFLGTIPLGAEVSATGRWSNASGEVWIRVTYKDGETVTGWVYGRLFDTQVAALPFVDLDAQGQKPMQSFYFRPGIGQTTCADAPTNGMLIQTPEGAGLVSFSINGVDVSLGSTMYISGSDRLMTVALLEGTGHVTHAGVHRRLVPGSHVTVNLDGAAESAAPTMPEPLPAEGMEVVQMALDILPRRVSLPVPATASEIADFNPADDVVTVCASGCDTAQPVDSGLPAASQVPDGPASPVAPVTVGGAQPPAGHSAPVIVPTAQIAPSTLPPTPVPPIPTSVPPTSAPPPAPTSVPPTAVPLSPPDNGGGLCLISCILDILPLPPILPTLPFGL